MREAFWPKRCVTGVTFVQRAHPLLGDDHPRGVRHGRILLGALATDLFSRSKAAHASITILGFGFRVQDLGFRV